MFSNIFIQIDKRAQLTADCFYYDAEKHYLKYHVPGLYQSDPGWVTVSNVICDIKTEGPLFYIWVKTIKE